MTNEFISPNWHVVLLHSPLGLLTVGVLIEIISCVCPKGGFRAAGRWMMLLGALLAIPTATLGIYAFRDVVTPAPVTVGPHWQQIVQQSKWSDVQWEFMEDHIWMNSVAVVLVLVAVVFYLGGSDRWRRSARLPLLLVMLAGVGFLAAGAWHGGELVYRYGTAVGTTDALAAPEAARTVQYYAPPLQLHLAVAGFTAAFIVGAFGLMIRRGQLDSAALVPLARERPLVAPAIGPAGEPVSQAERVELRSAGPYGEERVAPPPPVYPGWFWLGAALVGLGTAVAGYWSLAGYFTREAFEDNLHELGEADHRRLLVHVIFGVSLIVLSLILAGLVRFARRWRVLAGILGSLVLLLLAGQVWLGILMTYDGYSGPLVSFASEGAAAGPHEHAAQSRPREPVPPRLNVPNEVPVTPSPQPRQEDAPAALQTPVMPPASSPQEQPPAPHKEVGGGQQSSQGI